MCNMPEKHCNNLLAMEGRLDDRMWPDEWREAWKWLMEWLDNLPTMPQPDWSTAPEWGEWHSIDSCEIAIWWEVEPEMAISCWDGFKGRNQTYGVELPLGCDWRLTLQRRPDNDD